MHIIIGIVVGLLALGIVVRKIRNGEASLNLQIGIFALLAGIVCFIGATILPLLETVAKCLMLVVLACLVVGIFKTVFRRGY